MRNVLFIDDGDVISDNHVRGREWRRLVGPFLAARLGGEPEEWAGANRSAVPPLWSPEATRRRWESAGGSYELFYELYLFEWLSSMCGALGRNLPDRSTAIAIAREATDFVTRRVQAACPGAADAIRALKKGGYRIFLASSGPSWELRNYLESMGIADCFENFYGPDLVNTLKFDPLYYPAIFADAGVSPAAAIVVDDNANALAQARRAGAQTVRIGAPTAEDTTADLTVPSLAALPAGLAGLGRA